MYNIQVTNRKRRVEEGRGSFTQQQKLVPGTPESTNYEFALIIAPFLSHDKIIYKLNYTSI